MWLITTVWPSSILAPAIDSLSAKLQYEVSRRSKDEMSVVAGHLVSHLGSVVSMV